MNQLRIDGKTFKCNHIWFSDGRIPEDSRNRCDLCVFHGMPDMMNGRQRLIAEQKTLMTDLTLSADEIFNGFQQTYKQHIRRSQREGIQFIKYTSQEICNEPALLDEFAQYFMQMYESKNMVSKLDKEELLAYAENNMLVVTCARDKNCTLVYHSYIYDKDNARAQYSCSLFRNQEDKEIEKEIGRANKFLNWNDILLFKEMGVSKFDWGGIHSFSEPNGIDMFKMSFGGYPATYYNITIPCSLKGFIYVFLKRIKNKVFQK